MSDTGSNLYCGRNLLLKAVDKYNCFSAKTYLKS